MLEVFTYEIIPEINKRTKRINPCEVTIQPSPVALANNKHDIVSGVLAVAEVQLMADLWLFSKPFDGDVSKKWEWSNVPGYMGHIKLWADVDDNGLATVEAHDLHIPIGSQDETRKVYVYLTSVHPTPPARISLKIEVEQARRD